jgi:hypothetical protein
MKHVINLVFLLVIASLVACDNKSQNTSTKNTAKVATPSTPSELPQFGNLSSIVKQPLKVTDWAYAVPLQGISTVNVWKKAGAKNTSQNQVVATLNESVRVGILERKALSSGSIYFHVELEDGRRGFIGRPFISRDIRGNAFYEKNSKTGEILRDGSGYSYSHHNNCITHVAALMTGDLSKGEFETTAEFEQRKQQIASKIPWFSKDITYTYVHSISGSYDADKQTFSYSDYDLPKHKKETDYPSRKEIPYLEFDNDCTAEFGYQWVRWEEDYKKKSGKAKTLLRIRNATIPKNFIDPKYGSIGYLGVIKKINRADARNYKNTNLYLGVKPTSVQSVKEGSNYAGYGGPSDHRTSLNGEVSYIFLITQDGKNVIESYVSAAYKNSWQKDLQSQLTIAGYDVGLIDGFAGDVTEQALISAAADGVLPNAEMSMRSTMMLINHNRIK